MFLFKRHKKFTHRNSSLVGFVLAVMSVLSTAIIVYALPIFGAWLNVNGVFHLDLFLLAFAMVLFLAVQGLLLFGFPLYYAQDKKSHMTGFQILIYALMWMVLIVLLIGCLTVVLDMGPAGPPSVSDFI